MIGVVACEALYNEVARLRPNAAVRYVPQELHEFPVNVPHETDVQGRLQAAIDGLEGGEKSELDRIVVLYANSSADVAALQSTRVPLVAAGIEDCVSALLDRSVSPTTGEAKARGVYYLTRGTIDCGIDGYKLHEAYRGELDPLLARFEAARESHPDLRVAWPDGELFRTVAERGRELSLELLGDVFYDLLGGFERVELVDTGDLYDIHREYAESFRSFIEQLSDAHGDGHEVEIALVDGDAGHLERALSEGSIETWVRDEQFTVSWPTSSVE